MPAVAVPAPAHRRHDISDRVWEILEPLLPGGKGKTGRPAQDNRRFINAVYLDFAHRRPLAGSAPGLRGLEEHPPPLLPLAGPERLGRAAGGGDG